MREFGYRYIRRHSKGFAKIRNQREVSSFGDTSILLSVSVIHKIERFVIYIPPLTHLQPVVQAQPKSARYHTR